jgi:hypothetical protein
MRRVLLGIVGVGAFVLSPQAACTSAVPAKAPVASKAVVEIDRAAQLRPIVEGEWIVRFTDAREVRLRLSQSARPRWQEEFYGSRSSLITSAHACNTTMLVKTASACIDNWGLPLDIEILDGPPELREVPVEQRKALLTVYDIQGVDDAELQIKVGDSRLHATLSLKAGKVRSVYGYRHLTAIRSLQRVTL